MCSLLQGTVTTLANHINDHRAGFADGSHMSTLLSASAVATDPDLIPSTSELAIRMAKMRPKGLGESNLGGELFAAAPHELARIYHPLYVKSILNSIPPVTFSGGRLVDLLSLGHPIPCPLDIVILLSVMLSLSPYSASFVLVLPPTWMAVRTLGNMGVVATRVLHLLPTYMPELILILLC